MSDSRKSLFNSPSDIVKYFLFGYIAGSIHPLLVLIYVIFVGVVEFINIEKYTR